MDGERMESRGKPAVGCRASQLYGLGYVLVSRHSDVPLWVATADQLGGFPFGNSLIVESASNTE